MSERRGVVPFRPEAFTLAGDVAQIKEVIAALHTDRGLRQRLQAHRLVFQVRPPRRPRVLQWQGDAWQPLPEEVPRSLTQIGDDLPVIALVHVEPTTEARARGLGSPLAVPDLVTELRTWIRERGFTHVEACRDHTFSNPPPRADSAQGAPEEGYNSPARGGRRSRGAVRSREQASSSPEEGYNSPEEGYNSPEEGYNSPEEGYNSPEEGYNSPEEGYNSPDLVTPGTSRFQVEQQVALRRIGWRAWREAGGSERGAGVTVVILDSWPVFGTGADFDHSRADLFVDYEPALVGAQRPEDDDLGCNFTTRHRTGRYDANLARRLMPYHGPLCASLIRAVAPDARIVAVRVLDNDGNGYASVIGEAIRWVMSNPTVGDGPLLADPSRVVFNLSLGIGRTQAEIVENCCLFYTIHNACRAGATFACAVGNESLGRPENPVEPAAYGFYGDSLSTANRVFPVAGTAGPTSYAFFSNEGYLGAPAMDIIMDPGPSRLKRESGGANVRWRGTSFATPFVAGTLALLLSRRNPPVDLKQHLWERAAAPRRWNGVPELNVIGALTQEHRLSRAQKIGPDADL